MGPRAVTVVGVCTLMLLSRGARAQERPEALKRLEASRAALHTAHIEWSRWLPLHGTHFYFYTTRTAGDDVAWDQRGDEDGAFGRLPDGRPSGPAQTLRTLRARGEAWQYSGWLPSVDVYPVGDRTPSGLPELRALGMSYVFSYNDVHDTLWFDHLPQAGPRSFRTTVEEGLHVIRAKADHGDISWWLDPERGWCPVRVTLSKRGQVLSESRSTLKQLDGVWFPESVSFFRHTYENGKEPCEIVRVHAATFNRPEHPQRLMPKDIGIDTGFNVLKHDEDRNCIGAFKWDGQKAVTLDEYTRRERAGELKEGPLCRRAAALAQERVEQARLAGDPKLAAHEAAQREFEASVTAIDLKKRSLESKWESYTRRFIETYKLNDEQSDKAWSILKDCQARANAYIAKRKPDLEKLEKDAAEVIKGSDQKDKAKRLAAIEERRADMLRPLDEIFEKQLKPRLDKLPTRSQRRAAEPTPSQTPKSKDAKGEEP